MSKHCLVELRTMLNEIYFPLRHRLNLRPSAESMLFEDSKSSGECQFDEHFLQAVWNEQCFSGALTGTDGQSIRVVSPGTWNLEAGPDFRNAFLVIDGVERHGDVEIHRDNRDWWHHGHHHDSRYDNVILQAVWRHVADARDVDLPPCFVMSLALESSWRDVSRQIAADHYPYARQVGAGLCAEHWAVLNNYQVGSFLRVAGLARFADKTCAIQRKITAIGVDQALYEEILSALGYKVNQWHFLEIARQVPLSSLRSLSSFMARVAILFGHAGLLPDTTTAKLLASQLPLVHRLWDEWWRCGQAPVYGKCNRAGSRPMNSPERRLMAAVVLLENCQLRPGQWLLQIARDAETAGGLLKRLAATMRFETEFDIFTNFSRKLRSPSHLIGKSRALDLIANVLLPFLRALALRNQDDAMAGLIEEAYLGIPKLQDNRPVKEVVHRFLTPPSRVKDVVNGACEQQGLIGLYRDFCLAVDNNCRSCVLRNPLVLANPTLG